MTRAELFVPGTPAPQGSKSAYAVRRGGQLTGRVAMTEQNRRTKPWRAEVAAVAAEAHRLTGTFDGALWVRIMFVFPRPRGHYGTGRNAGVLRPSAPEHMTVKPDVDKLARAALDALTTAKLISDDARITDLNLGKRYVGDDEPTPGAHVAVEHVPS